MFIYIYTLHIYFKKSQENPSKSNKHAVIKK